jgi:alpha/beta superfamily hydrolase
MGLGTNIEIALLQSPQEQQPIVVVFGPESDLNGLQLQNGSNITVRGQECNAHNTPVLLAREVTVNGHTIQTSLARARMQRIQGEVTQTGQVTIPGLNETLEVAHLETNSGEPAIVVLGPHQRIQGHQPRRGDQISVRGEAVQINGQTVLLARTLAAGGKTAGLHGSQTQGQYR